jgi:hypothetical protein
MKRTKDLLIEIMNGDEELGLYEYSDIKYSENDLYNILLDFSELKYSKEEPIGNVINKFLSQLNCK